MFKLNEKTHLGKASLNVENLDLYHIAYLLPTRSDLANALLSLLMRNVELDGAADHGYSEAFYLTDPEGNGIEIYRDKEKSIWDIKEDGTIKGITEPLDADDLLTNLTTKEPVDFPEGTIIGHMHLSIVDLYDTKDFFLEKLGFDKKYEFPRQAIFMAAGEYHHHIAINV